jgi:hemoglobin-like flavoprotein
MLMSPADQELIRTSWAAVEPNADEAATLFYDRLFELDPRLKALFRDADMERQRMVLMQSLAVVVRNIDRLDQIIPEVEALGRRHAGYGVRADHYQTVGLALLWTVKQGLGDAFTEETGHAWADGYRRVSSAMIEAARVAEATSAPRMRRKWRAAAPLPLGLAMGSVST